MSKKVNPQGIPAGVPSDNVFRDSGFINQGWGNALLVFEGTSERLVGRLLTIVETLGLGEKQEKAAKSLVRQEVYNSLDDAWIVGEEDHALLRKHIYDFGQLSCGGLRPQELGRGFTPNDVLPKGMRVDQSFPSEVDLENIGGLKKTDSSSR